MAEDFKTLTPDTTFDSASAFLFGADSQAAVHPSIYQGSTIFNALLALANIWAATQTITQADNTSALIATGSSLTGANAQSLVDLAATWNTSGTPTAIKLNVTNIASNASSLLLDLQVGGVSQYKVTRAGAVTQLGPITFDGGLFGAAIIVPSADIYVGNNQSYGWSTRGRIFTVADAFWGLANNANTTAVNFGIDASDILAQRRGTNAQTLRWYHTFTDLSNRQNGALKTAAGYVEIAAETAGTGADDLDVLLTPAGAGNVRFGTHAAIGIQTVTGYIEIKDAGGTARRLAVVS